MAADLAPASYSRWILESQTKSVGGSPSNPQSTEVFFDANENLRFQSSKMAGMSSTLREPFNEETFLEHAYQSSEEALSPILDGMELSDEEQEMEPVVAGDSLWDDVKCFDLDMAISICFIAAGQPKMVNLGHFHSSQKRSSRPDRISSLPPTVPARGRERVPSIRLRTRFSNTSLRHYTFSASPAEMSPGSSDLSSEKTSAASSEESLAELPRASHVGLRMDSLTDDAYVAEKRHGSIFSTGHPDLSSTWTPPLSENENENQEKESELAGETLITPSFLQADPFESKSISSKSISGKSTSSKSSHSRFRSISTKFSIFGLNKQDAKPDEPKKHTKKERRNSLFRPLTPQSTGRKSNEQESQDSSRPESPQSAALVASNKPSPRESTFSRKRMVARQADEREPAIVIPPCPSDYDEQDAPSPLLRSSTFNPHKRKGNDDLKRRTNMSSLVVN